MSDKQMDYLGASVTWFLIVCALLGAVRMAFGHEMMMWGFYTSAIIIGGAGVALLARDWWRFGVAVHRHGFGRAYRYARAMRAGRG